MYFFKNLAQMGKGIIQEYFLQWFIKVLNFTYLTVVWSEEHGAISTGSKSAGPHIIQFLQPHTCSLKPITREFNHIVFIRLHLYIQGRWVVQKYDIYVYVCMCIHTYTYTHTHLVITLAIVSFLCQSTAKYIISRNTSSAYSAVSAWIKHVDGHHKGAVFPSSCK